MPAAGRFAIQRADLQWYEGCRIGAGSEWTADVLRALQFKNLEEAQALLAPLQRQGHRVFLVAIP